MKYYYLGSNPGPKKEAIGGIQPCLVKAAERLS
jgi:hypothetical protein